MLTEKDKLSLIADIFSSVPFQESVKLLVELQVTTTLAQMGLKGQQAAYEKVEDLELGFLPDGDC